MTAPASQVLVPFHILTSNAFREGQSRLFVSICLPPCACLQNSMEGWAEFQGEMQRYYGVDISTLSEVFRQEQKEYYLQVIVMPM